MLVCLICAAVLLSALGLATLSVAGPLLVKDQRPSWALFGFEVVVAVAAVLGLLFGRGRYGDGPGMALACIAGTILAASGLGWAGAGRQLLSVSLTPVLAGRILAAGTLAACGAWCVLSRHPRSIRLAAVGAALLAPVAMGAGAFMHPTGRRIIDRALGTSSGVQAVVAVLAFFLAVGLVSAGGHLLIRAFELGRPTSGPDAE
jgi:hypothetical protein